MTNVTFMPGVPIPAQLAADHDPNVASVLEDIAAGRIDFNTHECQGDWSPDDLAKLDKVLAEILADTDA